MLQVHGEGAPRIIYATGPAQPWSETATHKKPCNCADVSLSITAAIKNAISSKCQMKSVTRTTHSSIDTFIYFILFVSSTYMNNAYMHNMHNLPFWWMFFTSRLCLILRAIVRLLLLSNSACNVFIYAGRNREFRRVFHEDLQRLVRCLRDCRRSWVCDAFHEDEQRIVRFLRYCRRSWVCDDVFTMTYSVSCWACGIICVLESTMCTMMTFSYGALPAELSALVNLRCVPWGLTAIMRCLRNCRRSWIYDVSHVDLQHSCVACWIVCALGSAMRSMRTYSVSCAARGIVGALEFAMCSMMTYSISCAARGIVGALDFAMCSMRTCSFVACGIVGALEFAMCSMMTYSVSCAARGIVGALEFAMCSMRTCSVVACGIVGALESAMCSTTTCSVVACGIVGALESAMGSLRTYNIYCVACGIVGVLESAMSSLRTYIVSFYLSLRRSPSLIDRKKLLIWVSRWQEYH